MNEILYLRKINALFSRYLDFVFLMNPQTSKFVGYCILQITVSIISLES